MPEQHSLTHLEYFHHDTVNDTWACRPFDNGEHPRALRRAAVHEKTARHRANVATYVARQQATVPWFLDDQAPHVDDDDGQSFLGITYARDSGLPLQHPLADPGHTWHTGEMGFNDMEPSHGLQDYATCDEE